MSSEFVEYLESGLKRLGWSRYRLAAAVSAGDSTVYGLFNDERPVAGEGLLSDVAEVTGLDAEWLEILSGERAKPGTCRRRLSAAMREARALREENVALRAKLCAVEEDGGVLAACGEVGHG